eukprot:CAMPEP_0175065598 /NCGR_PEP_ID=MMETSP0052_2-20121109/16022_1 /TAXON_ID=51329 ORGANISM="Polytomella parva, Strain SAG 63-3" /NCGR_SAMPLE_ID=MMETSP0052_2 /ASSEMBLY_ACC=CAM_ASM_000194 /LENGTH=429 /DNA_ID=CAMNT_0016332167 /DNA_START=263 /DNA_END=1548 /DNA_ORIENTATION=-
MWIDPSKNFNSSILHEHAAVHYGVFPGSFDGKDKKVTTVWNVIRPHNWHPTTTQEYAVEFDIETGQEKRRVQLQSRFTHDAVRHGDRVFVADTDGGRLQIYSYPSFSLLASFPFFNNPQHVNTLAPLTRHEVWVVLHNLGLSLLVQIRISPNLDRAKITRVVHNVGVNSHGLVAVCGLQDAHSYIRAMAPYAVRPWVYETNHDSRMVDEQGKIVSAMQVRGEEEEEEEEEKEEKEEEEKGGRGVARKGEGKGEGGKDDDDKEESGQRRTIKKSEATVFSEVSVLDEDDISRVLSHARSILSDCRSPLAAVSSPSPSGLPDSPPSPSALVDSSSPPTSPSPNRKIPPTTTLPPGASFVMLDSQRARLILIDVDSLIHPSDGVDAAAATEIFSDVKSDSSPGNSEGKRADQGVAMDGMERGEGGVDRGRRR